MPTNVLVPGGLPIDLNGRQYLIDYERYARRFLPAQRQSVDSTPTPGASSFNPEAGIVRSQTDWSLGGAQEVFDDEEADPRRYHRVSLLQATRRGRIQLANKPKELSNVRGWGIYVLVPWTERACIQTGNSLFWFEFSSPNFNLYQMSTASGPYVAPVVNLKLGPSANSMLCLASDGANTTWLSRGGSGVSRATTETGAWTAAWSALGTNVIAYCNGHLLGIVGGTVWEFDSAGAKLGGVDIFTHPNTSWVWQGAVAGAGLIYLWGAAGNDAAVYVISDVLTGGTLAPPKIALPMPPGEYVLHMEPVGGFFVVRTNLGIRIFTPNGDILESGPLIVHRSKAEDYPNIPVCLSGGVGDSVMVAWRHLDSTKADPVSRIDLSRFAGDVPAHHLDEYEGVDGTVANNKIGAIKVMNRADVPFSSGALWMFGGTALGSTRRIWGVQIDQAPNSSNSARERVASGEFYSGWITLGATERKQPVEFEAIFDPLPSLTGLNFYLVDDSGAEWGFGSVGGSGTETSVTFDMTASIGFSPPRRFQIKVVLQNFGGPGSTSTPILDSWQIRSRIITKRVEEILLPVMLYRVIDGFNEPIDQDPYAEFVALKALVTAGQPVFLQEGSYANQKVFVDDIITPDGVSALAQRDTTFYEGTYIVRCLSVL